MTTQDDRIASPYERDAACVASQAALDAAQHALDVEHEAWVEALRAHDKAASQPGDPYARDANGDVIGIRNGDTSTRDQRAAKAALDDATERREQAAKARNQASNDLQNAVARVRARTATYAPNRWAENQTAVR